MDNRIVSRGFRFRSTDIFEIHALINDWRSVFKERQEEKLAQLQSLMATAFYDRNTLGLLDGDYINLVGEGEGSRVPLVDAWAKIMEMQEKVRVDRGRNPLVDFEFSICIYPFEGRFYGLIYTEQHKWREEFLEQNAVEHFGYFGNTDKPDEIDEIEWEERSRIWHSVLVSGKPASLTGFVAECTSDATYPSFSMAEKFIPSLESRQSWVGRMVDREMEFQNDVDLKNARKQELTERLKRDLTWKDLTAEV